MINGQAAFSNHIIKAYTYTVYAYFYSDEKFRYGISAKLRSLSALCKL